MKNNKLHLIAKGGLVESFKIKKKPLKPWVLNLLKIRWFRTSRS
jgi:hypothetical protein